MAGTEYFMVGVSTVGVGCIDDQPTRRIISFASSEYLRDLANADIFSCDGTFYTCPNLFYQIYSIHIPIDDIMTPVIYDFPPGKSQAAYARFFTLIKDKIADLGLVFSPTQPFTDQRVEGDRSLWNHYETEGPHTTNSIEGWHSKLKKMTQHAHPNIYTAIQLSKDIQNSIEITKIHSTTGQEILEH